MADSRKSNGNAFRDAVAALLTASGYHTNTEVYLAGKVVDILATKRVQFGSEAIALECKDYDKKLPVSEIHEFIHAYTSIIHSQKATQAFLITRNDITPHGRDLISGTPSLRHFTWDQLQRELFGAEDYLRSIISEYVDSGLHEFYIPPYTVDGLPLNQIVSEWINEGSPPPLAILGSYGTGKSTFAKTLAHDLAVNYLKDPSSRIPILVPLGEISDENSLPGLFGKLLTSQYRVHGYHYNTLRELNKLDRLVLIFDGLDEMKYGMSFSAFQRQCTRLLELHESNARVIILGRPNAFANDREFKSVIKGRITLDSGEEVKLPDRLECRDYQIRGFIQDEARQFVERYFRFLAQRGGVESEKIEERIDSLNSEPYEDLVLRPVHAQMLCQIATDTTQQLDDVDEFALYDKFVALLLDREVKKPGRYAGFGIQQRRRFNAAISWWLITKGGAPATTLDDVPSSFCTYAVGEVRHEFDPDSLRKELIQGCLVEKSGATVYFEHRSIQEFLAAEHLFQTEMLERLLDVTSSNKIKIITEHVTPEVTGFLESFFERRPNGAHVAYGATEQFLKYRSDVVSFSPYSEAFRHCHQTELSPSPWIPILKRVAFPNNKFRNELHHLLPSCDRDTWLLLMQQICIDLAAGQSSLHWPDLVAELIRKANIADHVAQAIYTRRQVIVQTDDYAAYCFFSALGPSSNPANSHGSISGERLRATAHRLLGFGPIGREIDIQRGAGAVWMLVPQQIYQKLSLSDRDLDRIRPYFNDRSVRRLIRPVEVTDTLGRDVRTAKRRDYSQL